MRILVDENIPLMTVNELKNLGHDTRDIRGTEHEGSLDIELWELAQGEKRLLITTDKGFAQYREHSHSGVLIVRLRQPNRHRIHKRVMMAIDRFPDEVEWTGMIVVMRDKTMSVTKAKERT